MNIFSLELLTLQSLLCTTFADPIGNLWTREFTCHISSDLELKKCLAWYAPRRVEISSSIRYHHRVALSTSLPCDCIVLCNRKSNSYELSAKSILTCLALQIQLATLAICATTTLAVQIIKAEGADLVNSVTGDRFQIVGVAYQPGGSSGYNPASGVDPLSDGSVCLRDAALMQRLGPYLCTRRAGISADKSRCECNQSLQCRSRSQSRHVRFYFQ